MFTLTNSHSFSKLTSLTSLTSSTNKKYTFVPKRNRKLVVHNNTDIFYQPKKVAILMGSPNDYIKMKSAKEKIMGKLL